MSALSNWRRGASLGLGQKHGGLLPRTRFIGPMPWVIAIMIALTVMAAAAGLALNNLGDNARDEIAGGLTVQIVEGAPAERERQVRAALNLLENAPDVALVRRVPDAELTELLAPWLGEEEWEEEGGIAMPALIDVRLRGPVGDGRIARLRSALGQAAPSARLDAQSRWLAPVFDAVISFQWLAAGLIVLLSVTTAAAVWLASRSALSANRETIEIVHLLGGTDRQIAHIFQRSVAFDAALGGIAGLVVGISATVLLGRRFADLGSGMVAGGAFGAVEWAVLAAIPLGGVILAALTARITVLGALRRML